MIEEQLSFDGGDHGTPVKDYVTRRMLSCHIVTVQEPWSKNDRESQGHLAQSRKDAEKIPRLMA